MPATATEASSGLLTDFYQLAMLQAYHAAGMSQPATFELYVRVLPPQRAFLVTAGLEQALEYLERVAFTAADIGWLESTGRFGADFLQMLQGLTFTGDVDAVREGTIVFAQEPLLRVTAPLPQAQLVESRLTNLMHLQTLVASKAARCVLAARGKPLVDVGMRRAHGAEAALLAARAAYIAGFAGTATVPAGQRYGIPLYGSMAHSFVQAHASEREAVVSFAHAFPAHAALVLEAGRGCGAAASVAAELRARGIELRAVRIDRGDHLEQARALRATLDTAGDRGVGIFVSGHLDEHSIAALEAAQAPIAGYGVGSRLVVSADAPTLGFAYSLQEYAGRPRRKAPEDRGTWPGRKQVYRRYDSSGHLQGDEIALAGELAAGEPLLHPVMRGGKRTSPSPSLAELQEHHAQERAMLPPCLRVLTGFAEYPVTISRQVRELARQVDACA